MGVDQKRPLAGFALVAVLCAVLMTLSMSRGWGLDLFHPGRPIVSAGTAEAPPHARQRPVPTSRPAPVRLPTELRTQPLGVARGVVARPPGAQAGAVRATGRSVTAVSSTADDEQAQRDTDRAAQQAVREAEREAAKAQRQAEHLAAQAIRDAERAAAKAQREVEHAAAEAQRAAERAAAQATREAERQAAQAARDAARQAAQAARDAAKAIRHP